MLYFDRKFVAQAEAAGIKILLYQRYVDDVLVVTVARHPFKKGCRVEEGAAEAQMAEEMRLIANAVLPAMLEYEIDTPMLHNNGRLPVLDLEVWAGDDNIVRHGFYKKSMASLQVVMAGSALPSANKRAILVAEAVRRMKNCSADLPVEDIAKHISTFNLAMKNSGHSHRFREVINNRAMAVYNNAVKLSREQGRPMWRSRKERMEQVREKGGKSNKTEWFKSSAIMAQW